MADISDTSPGPTPIAALPPTTVRQLSSSNVLRDPSSVVKELIDNSLDARTNAIFVDISANTLDSIQVKDTGHGISAEDRPLMFRRYCTSKIRDLSDLDEIGGRWLGFRGEALASVAEMSGGCEVVTRADGEGVAVRLRYGRDGELISAEHASAPVGTIVKVTKFLETLPVRKETALKQSTKFLAKIKRLMQAYALARPAVRFSLRVMKAKSNKGDFMYAPKKNANIEDAVLKIIGKHCALQCDWTTMSSDGFEIRAFLPRPDAVGSKIANEGAFLSIDGRPVSTNRGTLRKVVSAFKERLRKANPELASVRDPFFCMNIICPARSYDPNIEPAKDDVLLGNEYIVLQSVTKLLMAYYPEALVTCEEEDAPNLETSGQAANRPETAFSILEEVIPGSSQSSPTSFSPPGQVPPMASKRPETAFSILEEATPAPQEPPRWRSSMYSIDEEDLDHLPSQNDSPVIEEEEEGRRDVNVSNPWTIARTNAATRPRQPVNNGQLMTPAKKQGDVLMGSGSPVPKATARQRFPLGPVTPQTTSKANLTRVTPEEGYQRDDQENLPPGRTDIRRDHATAFPSMIPSSSPAPRRIQRCQQAHNTVPPEPNSRPDKNDRWFSQPISRQISTAPSRPRKSKRIQNLNIPMFDAVDSSTANHLSSKNNTDIRDFLGRGRAHPQRSNSLDAHQGLPSFTPINRTLRGIRTGDEDVSQNGGLQSMMLPNRSRASSDEPPHRSNSERCFESLDFAEQLRAYADREAPSNPRPRASSLDSSIAAPGAHSPDNARLPAAPPPTTDQEMNATFTAYAKPKPPSNPQHPLPRLNPASHEPATPKPHLNLTRHRTTSGPHHTRSSCLPLERVPRGHRIHNLVFPISLPLQSISKLMQKLDMQRNSCEWGYPADLSASDAFSEEVSPDTVGMWVKRVDGMLEGWETGIDADGVRGTLKRRIMAALHGRLGEEGDDVGMGGLSGAVDGLQQAKGFVRNAGTSSSLGQIEAWREPTTTSSSPSYPQTTNPPLAPTSDHAADVLRGSSHSPSHPTIPPNPFSQLHTTTPAVPTSAETADASDEFGDDAFAGAEDVLMHF